MCGGPLTVLIVASEPLGEPPPAEDDSSSGVNTTGWPEITASAPTARHAGISDTASATQSNTTRYQSAHLETVRSGWRGHSVAAKPHHHTTPHGTAPREAGLFASELDS
jgi:hypothetical protein